MSHLLLTLLLVFFGNGFANIALSQNKLSNPSKNVSDKPVVRVAISDFPPVEMIRDNRPQGSNIEIMNRLFKRLGLQVRYTQMPFKRCLKSLQKGESDFMGSLQYTDDRSTYLSYVEPAYSDFRIIFYMRKGEASKLQRYEDLYRFKVGVMRGYKNFSRFDNDPKIVKDRVNNWESNYKKLVAGRVDVIIDDSMEGPYRARFYGFEDKLEMAPYSFQSDRNTYFAISKKSPILKYQQQISRELAKMLESGEIKQIIHEALDAYY